MGQGMMMDHQYATENYAVEQYLLGEMNRAEREEFEEHYFSCMECAEAVRAGTYFADNAQFAGRPIGTGQVVEMKARPQATAWQRLSPAAGIAAAVLLAIVGYQSLAVRPADQPRLLARSIVAPAARGTAEIIQLQPGQKTAVVRMDLNPDRKYPYYTVDLLTQAGKNILHQVTEAPADAALEIASVPAGLYEISVRGQDGPKTEPGPVVQRSQFAVKE